jgi:4,5-dihydroxyphthalate decarboxylase
VREGRFDVSEMAIVTYLIAKAHQKPMVLLPAVVMGRFQHEYALYNRAKGKLTPADLKGKRVGVRSFTTTTAAWIRGILANDYAVDLNAIHWITFEEPHVAEFVDTGERAPSGKKIIDMLLAGELDAVLGERSDDSRLATLFAEPVAEARAWYDRNGIVPVNHMVVVKEELTRSDPDAVRDIWRMMAESKRIAKEPSRDAAFTPFGLAANRHNVEVVIDYAFRTAMIPRRFIQNGV